MQLGIRCFTVSNITHSNQLFLNIPLHASIFDRRNGFSSSPVCLKGDLSLDSIWCEAFDDARLQLLKLRPRRLERPRYGTAVYPSSSAISLIDLPDASIAVWTSSRRASLGFVAQGDGYIEVGGRR
jgi:hypothetical protein